MENRQHPSQETAPERPLAPARPRELAAPIFIGGTGRSGTTLLARVVGLHSRIFTLRWETQFIVAPGGLLDMVRAGASEEALSEFLTQLRGPWFRRVLRAGTPTEYEAGLCSDLTEAELEQAIAVLEAELPQTDSLSERYTVAAKFVQTLFTPATLRAGATRWCEKTPRSLLYVADLWKMFPNMRFLHIIRDGRDVALSMHSLGFWPIARADELPTTADFGGEVTLEKAALYWAEMLRLGRLSAHDVPRSTYLELRLEELVAEPRAVLQRVCDFVGEEFDPATLEHKLDDRSVGRWRDELGANAAELIPESVQRTLAMEGYPPA